MARREAESRYEGPSRAAAVRAARIARGWAGPTGSAEPHRSSRRKVVPGHRLPMAIIAGAQLAGAAACRLSARFCLRATDKISETDRLIDRIRALSGRARVAAATGGAQAQDNLGLAAL